MKKITLLIILVISSSIFASTLLELNVDKAKIAHNRPDLSVESLWIYRACFNTDGSSAPSYSCAHVTVDGQLREGPIKFLASPHKKKRYSRKLWMTLRHPSGFDLS